MDDFPIVKLKVEPVWLREKTDLSTCKSCKEKIFSNMIRFWIMSEANGIRLHADKTDVVLCGGRIAYRCCYKLAAVN